MEGPTMEVATRHHLPKNLTHFLVPKWSPKSCFWTILKETHTPEQAGSNGDGPGAHFLAESLDFGPKTFGKPHGHPPNVAGQELPEELLAQPPPRRSEASRGQGPGRPGPPGERGGEEAGADAQVNAWLSQQKKRRVNVRKSEFT